MFRERMGEEDSRWFAAGRFTMIKIKGVKRGGMPPSSLVSNEVLRLA